MTHFPMLCAILLVLSLAACGHSQQANGHAEAELEGRVSTITVQNDEVQGLFMGPCPEGDGSICWADQRDVVDVTAQALEKQLRVAEQLRSACPQLVRAEAAVCASFSELDRAVSPFFHYQDISTVMELKVERPMLRGTTAGLRTVGARVVFDPIPGLTEDRLKALVRCHLERHRAMAYRMEFVSDDPLSLQGVRATVVPLGPGLAIDVRAADMDVVKEVLRRVRQVGIHAVQARRR